ncbi:MAG: hypothetical protein M3Y17_10200, partial [Actinomycetota bacterium]|nr:hypothetical protein [Actinomycetota bacterium]
MPEALATALEVVDAGAALEPDDELELELPQAAINIELAAATATPRRFGETLGFKPGSPELSMGQVDAKLAGRTAQSSHSAWAEPAGEART